MRDDGLHKGRHGRALFACIGYGVTVLCGGIDDREIEDVIRGVQFHKEVKYVIQCPVRAGVWFVDLVDHHDDW